MRLELIARVLFAGVLAVILSGCLTHRTVSSGGQTISSGYVFKHPVKDAINNSR